MKNEFQSLLSEKNLRELPNILLVSAECAPLSKTGGLADVVGALPKYLQKLGVDARVITPYHRCIKDKYASEVEHLFTFYVDLGWRRQYAGIERLIFNGITIYLIDSEFYFGDTISLTQDVTARKDDAALFIEKGKRITLDLKGHTLSRGLTEYTKGGNVITEAELKKAIFKVKA